MADGNHFFDGTGKPKNKGERDSDKVPMKRKSKWLTLGLSAAVLVLLAGGITAALVYTNSQKVQEKSSGEAESTPPPLQESVKVENETVYVTAVEGLRLRKEASATSAVITSMPYGSKLTVTERADGWLKVKYGEGEGWCMGEYTQKEKPKDLSVRDVDFSKIITVDPAIGSVLTPEYGDFNKDGREEALVKVLYDGSGQIQEFYVYGYKNGVTLTKYLEVSKQSHPDAYVGGNQGHEKMTFTGGVLVMTYPIYKKEDPNCCPTGGTQYVYFKWDGTKFLVNNKEAKNN